MTRSGVVGVFVCLRSEYETVIGVWQGLNTPLRNEYGDDVFHYGVDALGIADHLVIIRQNDKQTN